MNEKDLVPSGLFSEEPDKGRRGFFAKLAALVAVPKVLEQAYQEPEEIPENIYPDIVPEPTRQNYVSTTACWVNYGSCSGSSYVDPIKEAIRRHSIYTSRRKRFDND